MAEVVLLRDTFTGDADTPLTDHTPEVGGWYVDTEDPEVIVPVLTGDGWLVAGDGDLYGTSLVSGPLELVGATTEMQLAVEFVWPYVGADHDDFDAEMAINIIDDGVEYKYASVTLSASEMTVSTELSSWDDPLEIVPISLLGGTNTVVLDISTVVTVTINGTTVFTSTDATAIASGDGMRVVVNVPSNGGGPARIGNVLLTAETDYGSVNASASSPPVLGGAAATAMHIGVAGRAECGSVLGAAACLAAHDFTGMVGDAAAIYLMDLVTPGGLVRAPISSWQATLQTGGKCYVQAVVPASTQYADAINAASEFVISRAAALPSGMQVEQEMARAPVSAQFDRGSMRETCAISGYADAFAASENPSSEYDRTLSRIRSMSSGAGGMRVRCAVDWLLRPGQRAYANGVPMIADYINYYAPTGGDSYMDVGERA